jgi:hypothetical protein
MGLWNGFIGCIRHGKPILKVLYPTLKINFPYMCSSMCPFVQDFGDFLSVFCLLRLDRHKENPPKHKGVSEPEGPPTRSSLNLT